MPPVPGGAGLNAISLERRLTLLFGFYVIALFAIVAILGGSLVAALFLIVVAEILFSFWRPTPSLGPTTYGAPTGAAWQTPITVMRWYEVTRTAGGLVVGALVVTVMFGVVIFSMIRSITLGPANDMVFILMAVWLITRWIWAPPLVKRLTKSLSTSKLGQGSGMSIVVGTDGLDIAIKVNTIGGPPQPNWLFHVAYSEIDELRLLDWLDAQAYWQTMEQYDPTLTARASWELMRYLQRQLPRPSIFQWLAGGTHLLIRGPSLLYLVAWADPTGPAAVAAWQAWRTVHAPPSPTA
jgi:hypothetical protein